MDEGKLDKAGKKPRTLDGQQKARIAAHKGKQALDRKEAERSGPIRVRGKIEANDGRVVGYYGVRRIREGQVFTIKSLAEFSTRWMERVDRAGKPLDDDGNPLPEQDVMEVETEPAKADAEDSVI